MFKKIMHPTSEDRLLRCRIQHDKDKQWLPFPVNCHRKQFASPFSVWVSRSTCTQHLWDQSFPERLGLESTLCCQLYHLHVCSPGLEISWHHKAKSLQGLQITLNTRPETRLKKPQKTSKKTGSHSPSPQNHLYKKDDLKILFVHLFSIHVSRVNFRGQNAAFTLRSNHTIFHFTLSLIKRERGRWAPHFTADIS